MSQQPQHLAEGAAPARGEAIPGPSRAKVFTRQRLPLYALLVAIGIAQAAGAIGAALLIRSAHHLIDQHVTSGRWGIALLALSLAAAVAVTTGTRAAEPVAAELLGQHHVQEVRSDLFGHLTTVPARHLGRRNRGNMLLRFVGDLSALDNWVSLGLAKLLVGGVTVTLAVVAEGTSGLAVVAVVVVGAVQAEDGHSSPGTVLAAVTGIGMLTGHLRDLGRVVEYAAAAKVARAAACRFPIRAICRISASTSAAWSSTVSVSPAR